MNAEIDTCDLKHQKSFDAIQVQEVGNDRQAEELVILSLGGDKFLGEKWRLTRATLQSRATIRVTLQCARQYSLPSA